jgi:hypothetical protein
MDRGAGREARAEGGGMNAGAFLEATRRQTESLARLMAAMTVAANSGLLPPAAIAILSAPLDDMTRAAQAVLEALKAEPPAEAPAIGETLQ